MKQVSPLQDYYFFYFSQILNLLALHEFLSIVNAIEIFCSGNNQQVYECISDGSVPDGTSFEINLFAAYCLDDNDNFTTGCKIGFIKDIRQ